MVNKILSLMKEGWMRKTAVIFMIAIFMVVCSVGVYAQETKTKVDPEKFKNLSEAQKKEFVESAKAAQKAAEESVKDYNAAFEKAKELAGTVARYGTAVSIGAVTGGPKGALAGALTVGVEEMAKDNAKKQKN